MAITRIENFSLGERHLFSGIYGTGVVDVFIDDDLRIYGLWEALYKSLRASGYTVVFYSQDSNRNFFSFRKGDLAEFYNLSPRNNDASSSCASTAHKRYVAQINSPFGKKRRNNNVEAPSQKNDDTENAEYDQIQTSLSGAHTFYRIADSVDPFSAIANYINEHPEKKMAFVFATAFSDTYRDDQIGNIKSKFDTLKTNFNSRNMQSRVIAIYNSCDGLSIFHKCENEFFRSSYFEGTLLHSSSSGNEDAGKSFEMYQIPGPSIDECRNLLNRRRILNDLQIFGLPKGIEGTAVRLSQEVCHFDKNHKLVNPDLETLNHYHKMQPQSFDEMIHRFDAERAIDRLRSMSGMESVITQLEFFIETLRNSKSEDAGPRFRPHLVFSGNPGTGKTTVARLFADILREEGLLERGHLVEATVGDLEGEYVGQTRIKTQALCNRARGGVLFIDEAYGLMGGSNHGNNADYGKEAIEVLMQFMENSADSLVILCGYEADMENLIQNGNQGFMRRFNGKESFIKFNDYTPEALYAIFQRQIKGMETDDEFNNAVQNIINHQYSHRTARWGNAGEMEKLASSIVGQHRRKGAKSSLSMEDIPQNFIRIISPVESVDEILKEAENLVGLNGVKQKLRQLIKSAMGQRKRALRDISASSEKRNLNFVFTGAPGTGKTTVANLMAKILYSAGIIDKSEKAVIVQKSDIIKSSVGGTPKATIKQLFIDHAGEVIFIDEAYGLTQHGSEAIDEITNCLTDKRFMGNQAVILAGYTQEMDEMLQDNHGLRSQFENIWFFEDYTNDELWSIFMNRLAHKKMSLADAELCRSLADSYFDGERRSLKLEFSNARKANQLFDIVSGNYDIREFEEGVTDLTIRPQDFPNFDSSKHNMTSNNPDTEAIYETAEVTGKIKPASSLQIDLSQEPRERRASDVSHFAKAVGLIVNSKGMGTAFVISAKANLIITAYHVIEGISDSTFYLERGTVASPAKLLWADPVIDMAILEVEKLPEDIHYFAIDHNSASTPALLEPIIHCGFVKGISVSDNFQVYEGKISGYDLQKQINESTRFDAILSDIAAINGCSGGPVVRTSDMSVIGVLQGGFEDVPTRIITDIHQLHKNKNLTIII
ncbi:AAA family ATPase [uncultured Bacteroides sp.]|uniref:AAA family ATPase n=1 Tax=uncultured Bacteroides sp. TaxID=162156 RepID=UPI0025F3129A|nr:AAA family ATPase [uncultured Bacteroides sp.]